MISRWEDLEVLKAVLVRKRCRPGQPLRPEEAAASCALAEVCVWAWALSPGRLRPQPRAEDPVKVRGQRWSLASQFNLSAQRRVRKAKITQVNKTLPHIILFWAAVCVRLDFTNPKWTEVPYLSFPLQHQAVVGLFPPHSGVRRRQLIKMRDNFGLIWSGRFKKYSEGTFSTRSTKQNK